MWFALGVAQGRTASSLNGGSSLLFLVLLTLLVLLVLVSVLWLSRARLRKTQAALLEREAMFRMLFEHSAVGAAQTDAQTGRFVRVNSRLCEMLGWSREELLKMGDKEVTHPDDLVQDQEQIRRILAGEIREYARKKRYVRKDGSNFPASLSVAAYSPPGTPPLWFIVVIQDISMLQEAEDQLIQTERLAAVGQLSAGIAHEFNNMLMIILGHTELLRTQLEDVKEVTDTCNILSAQVLRGRDVVAQLMGLANPSPLRMELLKLDDLVEEVVRAQSSQMENERIELVREYGPSALVNGDYRQLHQVVATLVINARHAIRIKGGGRITVKTALNGRFAELTVIDNGVGMNKETKRKIFTPFFTTKGGFATNTLGIKGSGLGLCVCLRTVQMHSGKLNFESAEGTGSRFTVMLPVKTASSGGVQSALFLGSEKTGPLRSPRLLVVDDEAAICNLLRQLLRTRGFNHVDTAESGQDGLEKMETGIYDIAFVDLMMSGMGGLDLLKVVRSKGIETRFIFISGQLGITEEELVKEGASGFLYKPFSAEQLDQIMYRVLNQALNSVGK